MPNTLTDPPFAANPPVKLNINAKVLGLVIGILAVLGLILGFFAGGLLYLFSFGSFAPIWLIGVLLGLAADVLAAIGGFQMWNLNRNGKNLVIYGLALGLAGAVVGLIGQIIFFSGALAYVGAGSAVVGLIIDIIIYGIIYYLVVISRFPGEAPVAPASYGGGYGGTPPPPPPSV